MTEFEDHIYVAMDAEILVFLHDLVMSYVREKDHGNIAGWQTHRSQEDGLTVQQNREIGFRAKHFHQQAAAGIRVVILQ